MRTMTWEEIEKDWGGLQKRHRGEIAEAVARYCIGHSQSEVAEHLGYTEPWVRTQLDSAGIHAALGGGSALPPLTGSGPNVANDIPRIISQFSPNAKVEIVDDGRGNRSVGKIEGKDAKEFEPYVEHYSQQGHEPAAAVRMAKAEWAAEIAVEKGIIKEDVGRNNERVNRILFPEDGRDTFDIDLKMHMARVQAAAHFLDQAKVSCLRRKSSCEKVAAANEKWSEQVDRVLNLHPTFAKE